MRQSASKRMMGATIWVELMPQEFYVLTTQPQCAGRHFIDFNADSEEDTEVLMMEVTAEEYADWDRRRHQYRYRREKDREYEENTISLDQPVPNGKGMLFHEVVAAETDNTEAMAVHLHELTVLHAALEGLDSEEKALINALYFDNSEQRGEREIAKKIELPQKTLNNRKRKIFGKTKKTLAQNPYFSPNRGCRG